MSPSPCFDEADPTGVPSLLSRCALGDQAAFAELYDTTSSRVYGLVLRVVRDPALAERVTQDVYLQAWHVARAGDEWPSGTACGLLTSAHRQAVDSVRAAESDTASTTVGAPVPVAADTIDKPGGPDRIRTALARLSLPQREAIELAYFGGYTHAEVAVLVGSQTDAVRALIRDGLRSLRGSLPEPA